MSATHFSGPIVVGDQQYAAANSAGTQIGPNTGLVPVFLELSISLPANAAVSATGYLPLGSRILEIIWDVRTAGNAATSVVGTCGTAAAGTQYSSAVDLKTAGRTRAHTAAQLTTMATAITNPVIVATATPTGGSNTQGTFTVLVCYIPGGSNLP